MVQNVFLEFFHKKKELFFDCRPPERQAFTSGFYFLHPKCFLCLVHIHSQLFFTLFFSLKQHIAKIDCPMQYDVPIVSSLKQHIWKNHYLLQFQVEQQSTVEWDRFSCQNVCWISIVVGVWYSAVKLCWRSHSHPRYITQDQTFDA